MCWFFSILITTHSLTRQKWIILKTKCGHHFELLCKIYASWMYLLILLLLLLLYFYFVFSTFCFLKFVFSFCVSLFSFYYYCIYFLFFDFVFIITQRDSVAWPYMKTHTLGSCNNMYMLKWDYVNHNMHIIIYSIDIKTYMYL